MGTLKTYPVDLLGTAPSNKISGETRTIATNADRIFIPTGGPYFTSTLKVWAGTTLLSKGAHYEVKELNRNATLDSGKEVCNAIYLKHAATTFTLQYQVIGGEYAELAREIADFIKGTPINDLTKLDYNSILYKPTKFPPAPHVHPATDWLGYGESIYILDQVRLLAARGSSGIYEAIKTHARNKIEDFVAEYIELNGVVTTDPTPTVNGNVLLLGNGKQPNPVRVDLPALFDELDERYFRNLINPLVRVGAVSDSFLPVTTGFFNVTAPLVLDRQISAVAKVERNGNLLTLLPASNGEVIRYVYGYVRRWTQLNSLSNFKATNQQYRPPGLASDEEIMDLMGINNQTMIATIYQMQPNGKATFKEHAIVELNDTLLQESHVLVRIGQGLMNAYNVTNPNQIWASRASAARMRDGTYRLIMRVSNGLQGGLQVYKLNADKTVSKISQWNGYKETRVVSHVAGEKDDTLSITKVPLPTLVDGTIQPFKWLKSSAQVNEPWILDDTVPDGYTLGRSRYNDELVVYVKGEDIYCNMSFADRLSLYRGGVWKQNLDNFAGVSYRVSPNAGEFYWLRTKSAEEEPSQSLINAETGIVSIDPNNPDKFNYLLPYDMVGGPNDVSAYWNSTQIRLADGRVLWWRPKGSSGVDHLLQMANYPNNHPFDVISMFNGYNSLRLWRNAGLQSSSINPSKINLENPTVVPLNISAIPLNDNLVLLQTGSGTYGGGPLTTSYFAYKPSTEIVNYKTMDLGTINGFDVSDNRKLITTGIKPYPFTSSRLANGNCRFGTMVFQRYPAFSDQTIYRNVSLDYDNGQLNVSDPYYLKQAGFDLIEFAINSVMNGDRKPEFTSWAVIISPEDPTVALFDCMAAHANGRDFKVIRCAARLTWNASKELSGFVIRPLLGQVTASSLILIGVVNPDAYRWYGSWAMQYNADKSEAHWHGRHLSGLTFSGNAFASSAIHSYKLRFDGDGFPVLERYRSSGNLDARKSVVATKDGVGICWDSIAFGIYRVFQPFKNWDWVSGNSWDETPSKSFVWYTPRPTVSFKLRVTENIDIQLGGVYSKIMAGTYELTDPAYSSVVDPRNKRIYIYATLERGQARLLFSEIAIPETTYNVFIGKCITDAYGVKEADIQPVSRIGNYRASAVPQGAAFSGSSGTANSSQLLNWDADYPALAIDEGDGSTPPTSTPYLTVTGANSVNVTESTQMGYTISPTGYPVSTIQWTSANPSKATVDSSGRVTGVATGTVDIICRVNGVLLATKSLSVSDANVNVNIIGDGSIHLTESKRYTIAVTPSNYPVNNVSWATSDANKLSVNAITGDTWANRPGQVTLSATVNGSKVGSRVINVSDSQISMSVQGGDEIDVGKAGSLYYVLNYPTIWIDSVEWSSSNPVAVSVDSTGGIRGNAVGSATITCTVNGRYQASRTIACVPEIIQTLIDLTSYGNWINDSGYAVSKDQTFDLHAIFQAAYNRAPTVNDDVTFRLPPGYAIVAPSTGTYAITSGAWPADTTYRPKLSNAGLILGRGGRGARTNGNLFGFLEAGEDGGRAIRVEQNTLEIINSGTIASGGGGGSSGRGSVSTGGGGGGAPFGPAGPGYRGSPATAATLLNPGYGAGAGSGAKGGDGGSWGSDGQPGIGSNTQGRAGIVITGSYIITNIGNGVIKGR